MKRQFYIIIFVLIIGYLIVGCHSSEDTIDVETTEDIPLVTYPEPLTENRYLNGGGFLGVESERDYDKIRLELEKDAYEIGSEEISCTVINGNVGKGFYLYDIPFLEYNNNGEWVRVLYYSPNMEYDDHELWCYCAIEGNSTEENSTVVHLYTEYIKEQIKAGRYRLVVFVGPNTYYAEFDFVEK